MNQDTNLLVTDKGSIILPNGQLAIPGATVKAGLFVKHQENLATLLASGNLTEKLDTPVTGIDIERERSPGLPIAGAEDQGLEASKALRTVAGNDTATLQRLAEIKAEQEKARQAEQQRQAVMADIVDEPLTLAEAKELGILKS